MTTQELAQKILDEFTKTLQAVQGLDDFHAVHQYACTMRTIEELCKEHISIRGTGYTEEE